METHALQKPNYISGCVYLGGKSDSTKIGLFSSMCVPKWTIMTYEMDWYPRCVDLDGKTRASYAENQK